MKKFLLSLFLAFSLMCGTALADPDVTLRWDANTDQIAGYTVYEQIGTQTFAFVDDVPCTANDPVCATYTTEQLLWETPYSWFVTAFSSGGESGPSNVVTHTTPIEPIPLPSNPTGCFIESTNPPQ